MCTFYLSASPSSWTSSLCKVYIYLSYLHILYIHTHSHVSLTYTLWRWFNCQIENANQVITLRVKIAHWYCQGWGPLFYKGWLWYKASATPFQTVFLKGWFLQPAQMVLFNKHCIIKVWKSLIPKTLRRHNHLNTQAKGVNEKYNQIECTKGAEGMRNTGSREYWKDKRILFFHTGKVCYFKTGADKLFKSHLPSLTQEQDTFKRYRV